MEQSPSLDAEPAALIWPENDDAAACLDPASLPLPRVHRAWDRQPQSPFAQQARYRKVYRRYETRSQQAAISTTSTAAEITGDAIHTRRVVKRLRLKTEGSTKTEAVVKSISSGKATCVATRWERRKSALPRKARRDAPQFASDSTSPEPNPSIMTEELTDLQVNEDSAELHGDGATTPNSNNDFAEVDESDHVSTAVLDSPDDKATTHAPEQETAETAFTDSSRACDAAPAQEATDVSEDIGAEHEPILFNEKTSSPSQIESISGEVTPAPLQTESAGQSPSQEELQTTPPSDCPSVEPRLPSLEDALDITEGPAKCEPASNGVANALQIENAAPEEGLNANDAASKSPQGLPAHSDDAGVDSDQGLDDEGSTSSKDAAASSLEPNPEDLTTHLEEDTAILKDFLSRAAASKASRVSSIAKRTSLSHRRDSDAVRQALASPRKVLEDKDPNSPSLHRSFGSPLRRHSPNAKTLLKEADLDIDLDLGDAITELVVPESKPTETSAPTSTRRSARTRSRIPLLPSATPTAASASSLPVPNKIPVRRADGTELVVVKKTEAQELALLTRTNTRRNKGGALAASARLVKLTAEREAIALTDIAHDPQLSEKELKEGGKVVRWDEQLEYYQSDSAATLAARDDSPVRDPSASTGTPAPRQARTTGITTADTPEPEKLPTPRVRRLRGLGAANGTPAKALLAPSTLPPSEVVEASTKPAEPAKPHSFTTSTPASTVADAARKPAAKERKSRLATPRKLKLPPSASVSLVASTAAAVTDAGGTGGAGLSVGGAGSLPVVLGKENLLMSPPKKMVSPRKMASPKRMVSPRKINFGGLSVGAGMGVGATGEAKKRGRGRA